MKDCDFRWQVCAARARQVPPREDRVPSGFAARVVARGLVPRETLPEVLWERLGMRWLAGAAAFLVICAVIEWPHLRSSRPLDPGVENTVAQLVWSL